MIRHHAADHQHNEEYYFETFTTTIHGDNRANALLSMNRTISLLILVDHLGRPKKHHDSRYGSKSLL